MNAAGASLASLRVFSGQASPVEARVYAELAGDAPPGVKLAGTVRGPISALGRTLPATIPLVDRGAHPALLAEAIVPDPCLWAPGEPFLYQVHVELRGTQGAAGASVDRTLGIRALGVRGRRWLCHGKPWVLRAVDRRLLPEVDLRQCREASAAIWTAEADQQLVEDASREGVPLAIDLSEFKDGSPAIAERLAAWPAVLMVVLDASLPAEDVRRIATLGCVSTVRIDRAGAPLPPWAKAAVFEVDAAAACVPSPDVTIPVIARAPLRNAANCAEARSACDALQARLAGVADWAGYVV